jgi:ribosomal protein S8
MSELYISPSQLSQKFKCDKKETYRWLEEKNIKKKGYIHGIDYVIDEKIEQQFIEWLKSRRDWTFTAVAKRNNCKYRDIRMWLKKNNLKFNKYNMEQNKNIEKQFAESFKRKKELKQLKLNPLDLSKKYRCELKNIYRWLEEKKIKKKGYRHGIDYVIDEKIEQQFIEWLKSRRERKKTNASGVAERNGCSRQLVCVWAKENGIKKVKNQYLFTDKQENMFSQRRRPKSIGK